MCGDNKKILINLILSRHKGTSTSKDGTKPSNTIQHERLLWSKNVNTQLEKRDNSAVRWERTPEGEDQTPTSGDETLAPRPMSLVLQITQPKNEMRMKNVATMNCTRYNKENKWWMAHTTVANVIENPKNQTKHENVKEHWVRDAMREKGKHKEIYILYNLLLFFNNKINK